MAIPQVSNPLQEIRDASVARKVCRYANRKIEPSDYRGLLSGLVSEAL